MVAVLLSNVVPAERRGKSDRERRRSRSADGDRPTFSVQVEPALPFGA
jgi:hypothetical protein